MKIDWQQAKPYLEKLIDNQKIIITCILSFVAGVFLLAYLQSWIIFARPSFKKNKLPQTQNIMKKKVTLKYWHHDEWRSEETELIWKDDKASNIFYVINNLLTLMEEEEVLSKKVSLESSLISPTGQEIFVSFDRNPFDKESSTFEKWIIIESILQTIKENSIPIQSIRFLVHHKPLNDYHLDFSKNINL